MKNKHLFSALIVFVICIGAITFVHAQSAPKPQELHLDAPVTDENSVRVDFGGAVLRVPKFLIDPKKIPSDPKKSIEMDFIGFTFWYPDMTLTCWEGMCGRKDTALKIDLNEQTDKRFKVYVTILQYSPDGFEGRTPRPSEIFVRDEKISGPAKITPSEIKGLNILDYSEAFRKRHPDWANYKPAVPHEGNLYINNINKPYELRMNCNNFQCRGMTYSGTHHFLAQFILSHPSHGVIEKTDQWIRSLNNSVEKWISP